MTVSRQDLYFAIQGLADGTIGVEDALALAEHNPDDARGLARREMAEYDCRVHMTERSAPWRLAEFLWKLLGSAECLHHEFLGRLDECGPFLIAKMRNDPNSFSDEDLEYVMSQRTMLKESAAVLRQNRVVAKIQQFKGQKAELTNDVAQVRRRVTQYAFNPELNGLLDKVEAGLLEPGDEYDQAALLKHLRTFFEKLHEQAGQILREKKPETVNGADLSSCGQALDFLRDKDVLTDKWRMLGKALYGILSNEGVHSIKSKPEYARLCRNMVAEYAIVLFFELEQRLQ